MAAPGLPTVEVTTDSAAPRPSPKESPILDALDGQGGASAAAEFQRRHDARQECVITKHPRMGRFLLAGVRRSSVHASVVGRG